MVSKSRVYLEHQRRYVGSTEATPCLSAKVMGFREVTVSIACLVSSRFAQNLPRNACAVNLHWNMSLLLHFSSF